jgi:hypothetical protein
MDKKTKVLVAVIQVALVVTFIGYYFALYNGNENNVSFYTNSILIYTCFSCGFLYKKKVENKFLDTLFKVNSVLFVIWVIIVIVQLFM